jgi:tetratricopeptide (TPR) repeat protein
MSALASGDRLDSRFTLIRPLGRGGMAEVWLVRDHELEVDVAAKIVPDGASAETIDLLRRECQNTRRLSHPNVVRVFDFHRGGERGFITMDYVEGEDLKPLRGGDPREILAVLVSVADALRAAHELGVIHRDLKTDNVVRDSGGKPHVLDFGIAALLAGDDGIEVAGSGSRHGMSPQQLDGAAPQPADDIYALGALLYELLSGHPPLWPEITDERIRTTVPEPVRSAHPLPPRLVELVAHMLAKRSEERPAGMAAIGAELQSILDELEAAPVAPPKKEAVRLTPPPRAVAVRPVAPRPGADSEPDAGRGVGNAAKAAVTDPQRRQKLLAAAVVAPLALVALAVFVFLPGWVERARETGGAESGEAAGFAAEAVTEPTEAPTPPDKEAAMVETGDLAAQAERREAAREAMRRAEELRDRLLERGVNIWAPEEFAAGQERMQRAGEQLAAGAFADAEQSYGAASRSFEAVAGSGPEILSAALERGRRALADGDAAAAAEAFMLAQMIDPQSSAAASGLRRAEVLDEVLALLVRGANHERDGRGAEAEAAYREAVALDPLCAEAQQALARVRSRLSDDAFAGAMSTGLDALERGDHRAAREAFQRAEQLRPGRPEVAEALQQVEQSQSLAAIVVHRENAQAAESVEDWHGAMAEYRAILALDPAIRFAQDGRARSEMRAELADRIDYHLAHPDRLATDQVFEEALELLVRAEEIVPAGPRHRQRIEALDRLLDAAGKTVPVILLSDLETEVVVYKVGRFGSFERRDLSLRPGTYTVVGSRRGYRDVRLSLVVRAGDPPAPLRVVCEEPI